MPRKHAPSTLCVRSTLAKGVAALTQVRPRPFFTFGRSPLGDFLQVSKKGAAALGRLTHSTRLLRPRRRAGLGGSRPPLLQSKGEAALDLADSDLCSGLGANGRGDSGDSESPRPFFTFGHSRIQMCYVNRDKGRGDTQSLRPCFTFGSSRLSATVSRPGLGGRV